MDTEKNQLFKNLLEPLHQPSTSYGRQAKA